MLAGHCDQIGFLVQHIDNDGFLVDPAGGRMGSTSLDRTKADCLVGRKSDSGCCRAEADPFADRRRTESRSEAEGLWLDIGAKDREQAASMIAVGDPITLELGYRPLLNKLASAPGMDDKTGLWVAIEALRRTKGKKLNCSLYAVSTVQEEIGLRGAMTSTHSIEPHVGIAIDVTHATDCPTIDKKQEGDISLGKGPVIYRGPNMNPRVVTGLFAAAKRQGNSLPSCGQSAGPPGTDANTIQTSRGGVAAALVSIPNRYMHSPVEVISLDDLDHAAELLAEFALGLAGDEDFRP